LLLDRRSVRRMTFRESNRSSSFTDFSLLFPFF
jgi:hypothetical protein